MWTILPKSIHRCNGGVVGLKPRKISAKLVHMSLCTCWTTTSLSAIQIGMQSFSSRVRGTPGCNNNLGHFDLQYIIIHDIYIHILSYIHYTEYVSQEICTLCLHCMILHRTHHLGNVKGPHGCRETFHCGRAYGGIDQNEHTCQICKTSWVIWRLIEYISYKCWIVIFWCLINVQKWTFVWI